MSPPESDAFGYLTQSIQESLRMVGEQVKDLRISHEQLRKDISVGFVSRDILDLQLMNIRQRIDKAEFLISALKEDHGRDIEEIKKTIEQNEQKAITSQEKRWLRVGTVISLLVAIIGSIIGILEFLHIHP